MRIGFGFGFLFFFLLSWFMYYPSVFILSFWSVLTVWTYNCCTRTNLWTIKMLVDLTSLLLSIESWNRKHNINKVYEAQSSEKFVVFFFICMWNYSESDHMKNLNFLRTLASNVLFVLVFIFHSISGSYWTSALYGSI